MILNKNAAGTIIKRELKTFFTSPIAYIVIAIYLSLSGWFFFSAYFLAGRADMRNFFGLMPIMFTFTIPAITMRLFSEEYSSGTFEMLKTQPVTTLDIVIGKFLSAVVFIMVMIAPSLIYAISISFTGDIDWGPVAGSYIGAILMAGTYSSIGILTSSFSRNQIIAFIISAAICAVLTFIHQLSWVLPPIIGNALSNLGTAYHFANISKGVIDSRDILYFASIIFLSLYGSWLSNQEKK